MSKTLIEELKHSSKYYRDLYEKSIGLTAKYVTLLGDEDLEIPEGVSASCSARKVLFSFTEIVVEDKDEAGKAKQAAIHQFLVKLMELFEVTEINWKSGYDPELYVFRACKDDIEVVLHKQVPCKGKRYLVTTEVVKCGDPPLGKHVEYLGEVEVNAVSV